MIAPESVASAAAADVTVLLSAAASPDSDPARELEAKVFLARFGNTAAHLERLYGPWEESSVFLSVLAGEAVVTTSRVILPGRSGSQAMSEMRRVWAADTAQLRNRFPLEDGNVWDVATLSSDPSNRSAVSVWAVIHSLHILTSFLSPYGVALLDTRVLRLLDRRFNTPFHELPLPAVEYAGSESTVPVCFSSQEWRSRLATCDPAMLTQLFSPTPVGFAPLLFDEVGRFVAAMVAADVPNACA